MIKAIILLLSMLDLFLSYKYLKQFIKLFPDKDYILLEANPIIKLCLKKFKFPKGMFIAIPLVIALWIFIIGMLDRDWLFFSCGALGMMIVYHYANFTQLKVLEVNLK